MQLARRRLRIARYSIGTVAVTAFAAFGFVVRDAHPATHTSASAVSAPSTTTVTATATPTVDQSSASVVISPAPQAAVPQVQSSGS